MAFDRRPHGWRFDRIELNICWAAIETLSVSLKNLLLRELATELLQERVGPRKSPDRVAAAITSLHEVADLLGHAPSEHEYRQVRLQFPDMRLMADGTIRGAL